MEIHRKICVRSGPFQGYGLLDDSSSSLQKGRNLWVFIKLIAVFVEKNIYSSSKNNYKIVIEIAWL